MGQTMNLNFIIGFLVIFLGGAAAIVGIRPVLESQEWTETQILWLGDPSKPSLHSCTD